MATTDVTPQPKLHAGSATPHQPVINDFSIQVATVNGSGSQSSNSVLLRSIFMMGIPVSGKNLFPSNIAGLPTWFTIRANKHGWVARKKEIDVLIAMNPETAREDVLSIAAGGAVIYDEPLNLSSVRNDVTFYAVPFDKLTAGVCPEAKLRKLVKNMVYVGVAARLFDIDMEKVEQALRKQFKKKVKAADLNMNAVKAGYDYATASLTKADPFRVEPMNATAGKIIIDGNAAAALGCMFAGVTVVTWYPITPSSSLVEQLIDYLKEYRIGPDGKATFAVVQAEDELAAAGMVFGAGWAGARSMTSTAGPGISLMAEFVGLGYYAEIPGVIFDIQRVGPSTGLPTRTMQGDILACAVLSHGDTKHILLLPSSVEECFTMGYEAFDLAERFQTPIFVMSDLDLGMNNWMSDPFKYPKDKKFDRGKVLTAEDLTKLGGFQRYADIDGDGIPYRTLPGTDHPAASYFTRGSGHNEKAVYSDRPDDYKRNMDRLNKKYDTARTYMPQPEIAHADGAKIAFLAFGTTHWAIIESLDQLNREYKLPVSYYRLRALPFTKDLVELFRRYDRVYVVEQNRDGQMEALVKLELPAELVGKIRSIRHYSGIPIDARFVTDELVAAEKGEKN